MTKSKTRLLLMGTAAAMIVAAPIALDSFKFEIGAAFAQGQGNSGNNDNSGGGNSGGGNSGGGDNRQGGGDSGHSDDHSDSHSDESHGGDDGDNTSFEANPGNSGSSNDDLTRGRSDDTRGGDAGREGGYTSFEAEPGNSGNTNASAGSGNSASSTPRSTGTGTPSAGNTETAGGDNGQRGKSDITMGDILVGLASDDTSDRPPWAGEPGGKDGAGGGQPPTSGSKKGDLFGDLYVILRDDNGIPILTPEGWVQPLDAAGDPIPLDDEGHPVDESLTVEVELGRLNVGRAPTSVLIRRADEVIALLNDATAISTDAAGRLVLTVDGVEKTIDSPLENLAVYVALMTEGTIPGVSDLPGTEYDFLVDGVFTQEDLLAATSFLAAATDKTGVFTSDEIAYIDAFLSINTTTVGNVTYSMVDYSEFSYDRADVYGDVTVEVLVLQPDGSWVPTEINVYDAVFDGTAAGDAGTLDAFTLAAEDARMVINFIHEYEVPAATL